MAASATSWGVPMRPRGIPSISRDSPASSESRAMFRLVAMTPGLIELIQISGGARTGTADLTRPWIADLDTE